MNTLIPIELYALVYYHVLLFFVLLFVIQSGRAALDSSKNLHGKNITGYLLLVFLILYIGLRPVNWRFGDMILYALDFNNFRRGIPSNKDLFFDGFTLLSSKIMSLSMYFLACTLLYIVPLYLFAKKVFKEYWFYAFFMLVISFSFWAYGVNGIRNGIGTSIFLYAIAFEKRILVVGMVVVSVLFHKSLLLPALAFLAASVYGNTKAYLWFWLLCIPLSLILGSSLEQFFLTSGIVEEDRLAGYLGSDSSLLDDASIVKTGFRWDFIIYSMTGVFAGWFYIIKKGFRETLYLRIFNTYLLANGIWILVIRANFSNRFAYLSWFLLGIVIIYPLLKNTIVARQHKVIGGIVFLYFLFTYTLNVILA